MSGRKHISTRERGASVRDLHCSAPGCDRNARTGSCLGPVCALHYQRIAKHGTFENPPKPLRQVTATCGNCGSEFERAYSMSRKRLATRQFCSDECKQLGKAKNSLANAPARFWAMVDVKSEDECWEFKGHRNKTGYGRFTYRRNETQQAHRIAYMLANNEHPGRFFVCHSCDNPPCCNPKHLWLGTCRDNVKDMVAKGRANRGEPLKGEAHPATKLTPEQALEAYRSAEPCKVVAARYGVTAAAINRIRRGRSWAHLTGAC